MLATGTREAVEARREHLVRAIADFDAATITTTHGFCQEVLGSLGTAGDIDRGHSLAEDARDLVDEVVDDLYVQNFFARAPLFERPQAREVVHAAVSNPTAPLAVGRPDAQGAAETRRALAHSARAELDRRKRALALMTYDDLVTRLRATLEGPNGAEVAAQLRARYCVALVDEFQDTDPDQWTIMRTAFAHEDATLVLIGDPKQAVYAFRGADVHAYLDAAEHAAARPTLRTNWRTDQGLLDAYDALFGETRLGHEEIAYRQVRAADPDRAPGLHGLPVETPLRVRVVAREGPDVRQTRTGWSSAQSAREHIARDAAADIAGLLAAEPTREQGQALGAGDVAVLVRKNSQAQVIKTALQEVGVPAVINGAGSVFVTETARDWLRLLEALERPESLPRARAAALTPFLGWTARDVAGATDEDWDVLQQRLHRWAGTLRRNGVATLLEAISAQQQLSERLLSVLGGERELTDLRQLGELLHAAAVGGRSGVTALAGWLRRRMAADDRDAGAEDRVRRLESDAAAVQVLTIHRSKGLEFPVVYCPFLWDPIYIPDQPRPAVFHDDQAGGTRTIDVAMDPDDAVYRGHLAQDRDEQHGEELRLAYVALTRAKHQAVIWWTSTFTSRNSPLGHLLFGGPAPGGRRDASRASAEARERFLALAEAAPNAIRLERAQPQGDASFSARELHAADLAAASFNRSLDPRWRRLSYTAITAGAYEMRVASEVEEPAGADDPADDHPLPLLGATDDDPALLDVPSLLSNMPAGRGIGTFVHQILEETDFAAPDLARELDSSIASAKQRRAISIGDEPSLARGLSAVIETPLGPLVANRRLRDLAPADRLVEVPFEMPLVGGDRPDGELTLTSIAAVLREHLADEDPMRAYADRLADPVLKANLRGYLTGTIDLVARVDGGYAILDYKSNRLAAAGEPLTAWHHRPAALAEEMQRSHYVLQALFYAVALHRYLRWRLPGYDIDRDRISLLYLFLRGMTGPETPRVGGTPCGVFGWQPPAALIPALSDVLGRGSAV